MPAAALDFAPQISVFGSTLGSRPRMSRLRNKLIDDAAEILLDEHVVVAVEDNTRPVIYQHLMNGLAPTGTILGKFVCSGDTFAAPFPERSCLFAAALVAIAATDKVMQEYEPQLRIALLKRLFQPVVLMLTERPVPVATAPTSA